MLESLAGKVAIVTGGGSGIGAAIVESLTRAGVTCHAIGRRGPVKLDVSDQPAVQRFVDSLDRLDILVCAAADQVPKRKLESSPRGVDHMIAVNLSGASISSTPAPKPRGSRRCPADQQRLRQLAGCHRRGHQAARRA